MPSLDQRMVRPALIKVGKQVFTKLGVAAEHPECDPTGSGLPRVRQRVRGLAAKGVCQLRGLCARAHGPKEHLISPRTAKGMRRVVFWTPKGCSKQLGQHVLVG